MRDQDKRVYAWMLTVAAAFCMAAVALRFPQLIGIEGIAYPDGRVVGGDFINLWSAGRLLLEQRVDEIYRSAALQAYQESMAGLGIGLRLWVYPPYSLFLAAPFGLLDYYPALVLWTVMGLGMLYFGARQFGFSQFETLVILVSPATQLCIDNGQTGNFAAGLLLLCLAPARRGLLAPLAAGVLTIKPQLGILLPLYWLLQRRWRDIVFTGLFVVGLVALSLLVWSPSLWVDYLHDTLATLSTLERHGTGPFMRMIPSVFMSMRITLADPELALLIHAGWAVVVGIVLLWRLVRVKDATRRAGLVLVGTVLLTPYIHNYDLNLLTCGALLALRQVRADGTRVQYREPLVVVAYIVPILVLGLNAIGLPISPLLILPLIVML